jgi:hypothetical protein
MAVECSACGLINEDTTAICDCGASLKNAKHLRAHDYQPSPLAGRPEVVVADIRMNFGSMVVFMIKWVLASIPAFLILSLVFGLVLAGGVVLLAILGVALPGR